MLVLGFQQQDYQLGGGFKHFLFFTLPGEMIQFDDHIFQMGWFNHQPDIPCPEKNQLHLKMDGDGR